MALKLIHTADWHLGQTFFGFDRDNEHDAFLSWLIDTLEEQQTDVLLIAGDVFDVANPSAVAQRRFFHFLKEANSRNPGLQIVIIAGNHDSAARLEAPVPLLEELKTSITGIIKRKDDGTIDFDSLIIPLCNREGERQAFCLAVPFLRQGDYPSSEEEYNTYVAGIYRMYKQLYAYAESKKLQDEAIVAMGHLHATGAELSDDDRSERIIMGGLESVSVDAFDAGLAYTALGHIHKAQRVGGKDSVRYAGSPLPMSFSETNYLHQVVAVTIDDEHAVSIESLPVPVTTRLIKIPLTPAPPDEVLALLAELPDVNDTDINVNPFLEVRVLLTEPDPGFRHRVEQSLEGKAVRLTSIVPSYPKREDDENSRLLSYNDLQKIDPLDMLKHAFTAKYGGELPEETEQLFRDVMREAAL
ncbi:exonuclease SbcCD subunit D [Parabacteroides bouchesdurhonensis]|uniref:exonuclease SbcCD subunit D n=1 Tax=Parabacteroides bouchesdurhonensis TaxID=1936995 RepID=UPI000E4E5071|nr:exonuclease SbcCD subunit D [Parabacteroides bouchesdurhonensis]RHJ95212.1 exonuclease SbcCD subunit D [Bacteroides sp. AM07-16]